MKNFRHLPDVTTLAFDSTKCVGVGSVMWLCPNKGFAFEVI